MLKLTTALILPLLGGLWLISARPVYAQTPPAISWTLTAVHASGSNHFTEPQIVAATGLKSGSHVPKSDLDTAATTLLATGAFLKVGYTYQTRGDGMTVTFQVSDATRFLPCVFDNFVWFSDDELVRTVETRVPLFDGSLPENGSLADDVSAALGKLLVANGIPGSAGYVKEGNLGQAATAFLFEVQGFVPNVSTVQITNGPLDAALFVEGSKLLLGRPYSRTLAQGVGDHTFADVYADHGYLRAKFAIPRFSLVPGKTEADPGSIVLAFTVDSGPQFHWAGLTWSGNQTLDEQALNPLITLKSGDIAAADKIASVWVAVQDLYGTHGYLTAAVRADPQFDDSAALVRFTAAITEGPQYRMGNLRVDAATDDLSQKLRAAWKLKPGEIFNSLYFKTYMQSAGKAIPRAGATPGGLISVSNVLIPQMQTVDVVVTFK